MPSSLTIHKPLKEGGAAKLGGRISSVSRPVGPSCPNDPDSEDGICAFLDSFCYAQRGHMSTPIVKTSWARNFGDIDWLAWSNSLAAQLTASDSKASRWHIGGDWLRNGRIDRPYLWAVLRARRIANKARAVLGRKPLPAWSYTHAWRALAPHRRFLVATGMEMFASVHTLAQAIDAQAMGYRIAWASAIRKADVLKMPKSLRPRGVLPSGPEGELRIPICPEQTGRSPDCGSCGMCFHKGGPNVAFLTH